MVRLLETPDLDRFANFHMEGLWDADGTRMVDAIRRVLGAPSIKVRKTPWWIMRLAAPFVPMLREVMEMKYLWDRPVRLLNDRLVSVLGTEPRTRLDDAVRATLADMGSLGKPR
jgi:nucleoside-diphosphate-sugar epimerase